jgi:hypothetical protein
VQSLADELEREQIEPWLCEVDIELGDNFVAKIEQVIRMEISSKRRLYRFGRTSANERWISHRGDQQKDGFKNYARRPGAIKTSACNDVDFCD